MTERIALQDIAEIGTDDMFISGGWWRPFGLDAQDLIKRLPQLVQDAGVAVSAASNKTYRPFALSPTEPRCFLLAAPIPRAGAAMVIQADEKTNEFRGMWPFVSDGTQHDNVVIDRLTLSPDRLEAMVTGTLPGGLKLTWHDTMFAADRAFYARGSVHSVILAGLVHDVSPGHTEPVVIPADNPAWSKVREHSPGAFNPDGSLTLQMHGLAAILASSADQPESHEVHGPVTRVQPAAYEMFGVPIHLVTILVARGETGDVALTLHLSDAMLQDMPLPAVGTPLMALIRLVGWIWIPNTGSQEAKAAGREQGV